jgi:hypothetical protein
MVNNSGLVTIPQSTYQAVKKHPLAQGGHAKVSCKGDKYAVFSPRLYCTSYRFCKTLEALLPNLCGNINLTAQRRYT